MGADSDEENGELEEGEPEETAKWGNAICRVRITGKTPDDGIFRSPSGWKYDYLLHEAVEEVPEYGLPWDAFRAIAEESRTTPWKCSTIKGWMRSGIREG